MTALILIIFCAVIILASELFAKGSVIYARLGMLLGWVVVMTLGLRWLIGTDAWGIAIASLPFIAGWIGARIHISNSITLALLDLLKEKTFTDTELAQAYGANVRHQERLKALQEAGYIDSNLDTSTAPKARGLLGILNLFSQDETKSNDQYFVISKVLVGAALFISVGFVLFLSFNTGSSVFFGEYSHILGHIALLGNEFTLEKIFQSFFYDMWNDAVPRFRMVSQVFLYTNWQLRDWLLNYVPLNHNFNLTLIIHWILGPLFFFKFIRNMHFSRLAAFASLAMLLTSVGYLSQLTTYLWPGHALAITLASSILWMASRLYKDQPKLLIEYPKGQVFAFLLFLVTGLFTEESLVSLYPILLIIFPRLFLVTKIKDLFSRKQIINALVICIPGFFFMASLFVFLPWIYKHFYHIDVWYFGKYKFNLDWQLIKASFKDIFGNMLLLRNFERPYKYSFPGIGILLLGIMSTGWFSKFRERRYFYLKFLASLAFFFVMQAIVQAFHNGKFSGHYYASPYAIFSSALIGCILAECLESAKLPRSIRLASGLSLIAMCLSQGLNFNLSNGHLAASNSRFVNRFYFFDFPGMDATKEASWFEIKSLWSQWHQWNKTQRSLPKTETPWRLHVESSMLKAKDLNDDGLEIPFSNLNLRNELNFLSITNDLSVISKGSTLLLINDHDLIIKGSKIFIKKNLIKNPYADLGQIRYVRIFLPSPTELEQIKTATADVVATTPWNETALIPLAAKLYRMGILSERAASEISILDQTKQLYVLFASLYFRKTLHSFSISHQISLACYPKEPSTRNALALWYLNPAERFFTKDQKYSPQLYWLPTELLMKTYRRDHLQEIADYYYAGRLPNR